MNEPVAVVQLQTNARCVPNSYFQLDSAVMLLLLFIIIDIINIIYIVIDK